MLEDSSTSIFGIMGMASPENASGQVFDEHARGSVSKNSVRTSSTTSSITAAPNFPPPKTDKPRPHVCTTCMRSFARLEHLKRHERSHTKEKPFECPECTRCFARRDLLLRHQQKLHSTTTPSSRPRNTRRESAVGVTNGRVRKNSMASSTTSGVRPRANTLSHVDAGTIGMLANSTNPYKRQFTPGHHHHNSLAALPDSQSFGHRGLSNNQGAMMGLKLETSLPVDFSYGLRTAPPFGGFGTEFGMNGMGFSQNHNNTINPHALHMHGLGIDQSGLLFQQMFSGTSNGMADEEGTFDWMTQGFENQMTFAHANETAIDDSSPSAMSTNSPPGSNEMIPDMNSMSMQAAGTISSTQWHQHVGNPAQMVNSPLSMDFSNYGDMTSAANGTISPKSLLAQNGQAFDMNLPTPPDLNSIGTPNVQNNLAYSAFQLPISRDGGASTSSTGSLDSSLRQSSVTTMSSDLVSDHIRNSLIAGLSHNNPFGQRKYSQPAISSPLSPNTGLRTKGLSLTGFPSTQDLQRYVAAYIKYFHPHLPFLHIPSLNFESSEYALPLRMLGGQAQFGLATTSAGGSCLVLSIAAIGALYEHDVLQSKDLFECAKRLISSYLEERRKANLSKTQFAPRNSSECEDTPLWLVQAMLLNVIYGHNCGDKTAAELASNHCAALVSLARGAELARPHQSYGSGRHGSTGQAGGMGQHGNVNLNGWTSMINENDEVDWLDWKLMEERKRTLYAVFILSSMLVTAYNHAPALTNSEIRLDLPCDEELWAAESAQAWQNLGGMSQIESKSITFAAALTHLLMSAQRQKRRRSSSAPRVNEPAENELKPSTFGCLILVNALHNYIWETRQRHLGRQWTAYETEQMHAHIEPALRAWQAAWASNPSHSLERPNPFGAGPLSADSIPLLDLAYVRLFINFGRVKEAFWQRDYDAMAEELAKGSELVQAKGYGNEANRQNSTKASPARQNSGSPIDAGREQQAKSASPPGMSEGDKTPSSSTKREHHLRRAAFYAADSLLMADKLGLSFAEHTSRELPMQSALCAFDCAQVLAEWVTTVQERVGKYVGLLGHEQVDMMQVSGALLMEAEDRNLLQKIQEIVHNGELKVNRNVNLMGAQDGGFGSRILTLTAHMLEQAAVWPITKLMAESLETQANHLKKRALASIAAV